jgi:hypothetical protein
LSGCAGGGEKRKNVIVYELTFAGILKNWKVAIVLDGSRYTLLFGTNEGTLTSPNRIDWISSSFCCLFVLLHRISNQELLHLVSLHAYIIFILRRLTILKHVYHSCLYGQ